MAAHFTAHHSGIGHPSELYRAALPDMSVVAMKRLRTAAKRHHCASERWNLDDIVGKVFRPAQQPQPPSRLMPLRIHVNEDGNDLGRRIRMDSAVLVIAEAAQCDHCRPAFK